MKLTCIWAFLIELHLPANLFKCQTNVPINLVADNKVVQSVHCRLADRVSEIYKNSAGEQSTQKSERYFVIKVEYFAHREKLLREELKLVNVNNSVELLKLIVTARVLGKGKGTPMLRNGIHCLGYESDGESAASDNQSINATVAKATTSK